MTRRPRIRTAVQWGTIAVLGAAIPTLGIMRTGTAADQKEAQPKYVAPAAECGGAPEDAIKLFNGKDLSNWMRTDGQPARWTVSGNEVICKPGSGNIITRQKFGDAQIHVEFATPLMPHAHSQARGNSGVYIQGRYEVQVLDSFHNETYPDGACGALYKEYPPLVNACRPPEQWQTYDIIFHGPKSDRQGKVTEKGHLTVLQNGVLVQDHVEIKGPTLGSLDNRVYEPGGLLLQDHGNTVKFRNIWVRALETK